jgi:hypothetical protein
VIFVNNGANVTFENLTIRDGRLNRPTYSYYARGAGIYNYGGRVTSGNRCTVSHNVINVTGTALAYGGGIYNTQDGTLIVNGTVSNNSVYDDLGGGGIWNDGATVIINGTVSGNRAPGGGGIANSPDGRVTVNAGARIIDNVAIQFDSRWPAKGGGVYNSGTFIVKGTIAGNRSDGEGGGVYANKTVTIDGGRISGNTPDNCAGRGGCR